jgi:putative ABC transport system permease protein
MTLRDLLDISIGNLWRMKLRAFLTTAGVVIAIAAFVSMLSFGAGNQAYLAEQFDKLGLFATMQVHPIRTRDNSDTTDVRQLTDEAVTQLAAIPGVKIAYPFDAFQVIVLVGDTAIKTEAQALPASAVRTKLFSQLAAGAPLSSDSANEAMATEQFLKLAGIESPDSLVGKKIIVTVKVSTIDSALTNVVRDPDGSTRKRFEQIRIDSLFKPEFLRKFASEELSSAISRFVDGYFNNQAAVSDTLVVTGVLKGKHGDYGRFSRMKPILIPVKTARHFSSSGMPTDNASLLASLRSGELFTPNGGSGRTYPRVTLDIDPHVPYQMISDSVKALGFSSFSYLEQFKEIQKFFLYFNLALGLIGLIAMTTASLGIVNTMVMSIIERTREIGVLKSLGADEFDIRLLFLVESGVIGAVGAVAGIVVGWIIARGASFVAKTIMIREGVTPIELFRLPLWLILVAFAFGFIVSILAGYYPASRAAGVDPVKALRNE